jgi:hypothetical protein
MSSDHLAPFTWAPIPGTLFIAVALWAGVARAARTLGFPPAARTSLLVRTGALLGGWIGLAAWLGARGIFRGQVSSLFPILAVAIVLPVIAGLAVIATSRTARQLLDATPASLLIGVQVYRILGAEFLVLLAQGRMPSAFAVPAGYGDVMVGATALVVAALYQADSDRWRPLAILWNLVGLADLVVAVTMGALTAPGPLQRFALDAPNVLITTLPLVLVPTVLVPVSFLLHLYALRRLRVPAVPQLAAAS